MSSLSKIFEKPFNRVKNFFMNESIGYPTYKKKKSDEFQENSFGMVEKHFEINENYIDEKNKNKIIENETNEIANSSTVSLYENEYSDFVILEFGDAKIISKEDWLEIFKKKNINLIPHKDLYISLQKGISFLMYINLFVDFLNQIFIVEEIYGLCLRIVRN